MTRVLFDKVLDTSSFNESCQALLKNLELLPWDSSTDLREKCIELKPDAVLFSAESAEKVVELSRLKSPLLALLQCHPEELETLDLPNKSFNDVYTFLPHVDELYFRLCLLTHQSYKQHLKTHIDVAVILENGVSFEAHFITTSPQGVCTTTSKELPLEPAALKCTRGSKSYDEMISIIKWSHPGPTDNFFSGIDLIHVPEETDLLLKEQKVFSLLDTGDGVNDVWIDVHGDVSSLNRFNGVKEATQNKNSVHFNLAQFDSSKGHSINLREKFVDSDSTKLFFHRCNKPMQAMLLTSDADFKNVEVVSRILDFTCSQCKKLSVRLVDKAVEKHLENSKGKGLFKCVSCNGQISASTYITKRN